MAFGYLILALVLAFTFNHANPLVRASGSLIAAISLALIAISIVLADFDGTFATFTKGAAGLDAEKPLVLNLQAVAAGLAIPFLLWTAWAQRRRGRVETPALMNSATSYGLVSRYLHWGMAALILCLIPIGLFVSVLPKDSSDRADFLSAHESLGLTVLALVFVRLAWLAVRSAPPLSADFAPGERRLALAVRLCLYLIVIGFPVSGFLMNAFHGEAIDLYGWAAPSPFAPNAGQAALWAAVHDVALPLAFYLAIAAHVGAAAKHHFFEARLRDVRRMIA